MLCAVDYIFNLLRAFNYLQPMKKFVFSVAFRPTGRLQIKPSGSEDENDFMGEMLTNFVAKRMRDRPETDEFSDYVLSVLKAILLEILRVIIS